MMGLRFTHAQARVMGGVLADAVDAIEAEGRQSTHVVPPDRPGEPVAVSEGMPEKDKHTILIRYWHPLKLNALMGRHPMVIHRLKQADYERVAYCYQLFPKARYKRRVSLTIILGPRQRGGDPDSYLKVLGDGLVQCGQLVDDSAKWVEWAPVQFRRGPEMGTEICLEDL
jgi:hypothetical protein